jgi:hypothetical protein
MRSLAILCGLHLLGNALILWLGYAWLSIPESNAAHLVWSVLLILLFVCSALWLHGTAFAWFSRRRPESNLRRAVVVALRHLPALFVLAIISILLYILVSWFKSTLDQPAFRLASWLTLTLRKPVPPPRILAVFHGIIWLIDWLLLPALLVPLAAAVSTEGFAGFRRFASMPRLWKSLGIFVLVVGAVWVPLKLLAWIPKVPSFSAEMASFLLRAGVAYFLFAGLLLVLEKVTSAGIPSFIQRSSSAMP